MTTRHYGDFEWDERKTLANRLKHDVPFEKALTAFADPLAIDAPDRSRPGRFSLIDHSTRGRQEVALHIYCGLRNTYLVRGIAWWPHS